MSVWTSEITSVNTSASSDKCHAVSSRALKCAGCQIRRSWSNYWYWWTVFESDKGW